MGAWSRGRARETNKVWGSEGLGVAVTGESLGYMMSGGRALECPACMHEARVPHLAPRKIRTKATKIEFDTIGVTLVIPEFRKLK